MGRGQGNVATVGAVSRRSAEPQGGPLTDRQIATQAVRIGLQVGAKHVFASFRDHRWVNANEYGVVVKENPPDLPFMLTPEYDDAAPHTLLEGSIDEFRAPGQARADAFTAVREFMDRSQATRLDIKLPGDKKLSANQASISVYEKVKRRRLPGYKQQKVHSESLRNSGEFITDISGLTRTRTS